MRRRFSLPTLIAIAAVAGTAMSGCNMHSPRAMYWGPDGAPRYEPRTGENWWHYQFVYFPNQGVYFEPYTQTYMWQANNEWYHTEYPPPGTTLYGGRPVVVRTFSELPFEHHSAIVSQHPPYWPGSFNVYAVRNLDSRFVKDDASAEFSDEFPQFDDHSNAQLTAAGQEEQIAEGDEQQLAADEMQVSVDGAEQVADADADVDAEAAKESQAVVTVPIDTDD